MNKIAFRWQIKAREPHPEKGCSKRKLCHLFPSLEENGLKKLTANWSVLTWLHCGEKAAEETVLLHYSTDKVSVGVSEFKNIMIIYPCWVRGWIIGDMAPAWHALNPGWKAEMYLDVKIVMCSGSSDLFCSGLPPPHFFLASETRQRSEVSKRQRAADHKPTWFWAQTEMQRSDGFLWASPAWGGWT